MELRALKPTARIPAGVLAAIGLLEFPVGTLINGYFLYLLFSKKGAMVFSEEYRQIVVDTPEIRASTPLSAWVAMGLLALMLAAFLIQATVGH